jgi:hypothetical protein
VLIKTSKNRLVNNDWNTHACYRVVINLELIPVDKPRLISSNIDEVRSLKKTASEMMRVGPVPKLLIA